MYTNNNYILIFTSIVSRYIGEDTFISRSCRKKLHIYIYMNFCIYYIFFVKHIRRIGKSICVIQWHKTDGWRASSPFLKRIDLTTERQAANYLSISLNLAVKLLYSCHHYSLCYPNHFTKTIFGFMKYIGSFFILHKKTIKRWNLEFTYPFIMIT